MKRAAAIIGPTPSFVRWAIAYDCEFRQLDCQNLPYDTFRQLRSMREWSIGRLEQRVVDGYCIHATLNREVETARGFPEAEVRALFGSPEHLQHTCGRCPANASIESDGQKVWAGCFGWFSSQSEHADWIQEFQRAIECDLSEFPESQRVWFRVWQIRQWAPAHMRQLCDLLEAVLHDCVDDDIKHFHQAVTACLTHGLELKTDLVPCGESDGIHWRLEPCCPNCRCEMEGNQRGCLECGLENIPLNTAAKKVLGLRPYMLLTDLLGQLATGELIRKYHQRPSQC